jgi:hypothetical protein
MKKSIKKAQSGTPVKGSRTLMMYPAKKDKTDANVKVVRSFSVDTTGYAAGKKKFPYTEDTEVTNKGGSQVKRKTSSGNLGRQDTKSLIEKPTDTTFVNPRRKNGGKVMPKKTIKKK